MKTQEQVFRTSVQKKYGVIDTYFRKDQVGAAHVNNLSGKTQQPPAYRKEVRRNGEQHEEAQQIEISYTP